MMDGKSQEWRDGADRLLEALARENKYLVSDMLIVFLESAGYGLDDYSPLGGVFKRAAAEGKITKIDRPAKQALWLSKIYDQPMSGHIKDASFVPKIEKGMRVTLQNFGAADGDYRAGDVNPDGITLELHHEYSSSTPFIEAEVLEALDLIVPDWQHAKLTKVGFHEQRVATILKLRDFIMRGKV